MASSDDAVSRFSRIVDRLKEYHRKALWQEKLRLLQEALVLCEDAAIPDAQARKAELLYDLGGIWRRLGQYDRAQETLQEALQVTAESQPLARANVLGELGVVLRHANNFSQADEAFQEQYDLARNAAPSLDADLLVCRAVGNLAMCAYNMSQQTQPVNEELLNRAVQQLQERIERAGALQERLAPNDHNMILAKAWEVIGMDRLSLCYVAQGKPTEAVRTASMSQRLQQGNDPSIQALSRFFYGNALWANGQKLEALSQWNAPSGKCSSPIALCKEPSGENAEYLALMAGAEVNLDSYDEQGYSALDYAVLSNSGDARVMITIITDALRKKLHKEVGLNRSSDEQDINSQLERSIAQRLDQAELRKLYRTLLQEHLRPLMTQQETLSFSQLRNAYSLFLLGNSKEQTLLTPFRFVRYTDFKAHGALPMSSAGLTKPFDAQSSGSQAGDVVVFISYRWLGRGTPDIAGNVQWRRMIDAVEKFLRLHPDVKSEHLSLWLDYACIDQDNEPEKIRGINSLPLAVTLCNAMISLVDDEYYHRAWCAVEMMLIGALMQYHRHEWWEHKLDAPQTDLTIGTLQRRDTTPAFDLSSLKLSNEESDRPRVDFLVRQSRLLGRDNASS